MHARTALLALVFSTACFRNPATGKLNLDLMSSSQEVEMGQQAKKETEQSIGLYDDAKLQAYVAELGKPLAAQAGRDVPFSYEIVDDSAVNAFALPGGPVFITRGIMGYVNSEAELVAVIGHETGHIAARHSANQMSKAQVAQLGIGVSSILSPAAATLGQVAGAGLQVLFLKYSRQDETQADALGYRYMSAVGYDPHTMLNLFDMLQGVTEAAGAGKVPEWQQTHPIPENRHQNAEDWLAKTPPPPTATKVERDSYLHRIDGIVFGDNPKNGYFKGDLFIQPELRFQLQFPAGWQHQNQAQAVVGVSKEQDAMVQLGVGGKMSPEDAAKQFFSQQGIQQGQAAQVSVNGMHAVAAYFQAQAEQGVVGGLVAFVARDSTTYMLLGYTAQANLQKYDPLFKAWIGSFNNVTDGSLLNVQPARVKIVQVPSPMSVAQFMQQFPSTVKPETIALINGVKSGGTIPAGLAKQVVGGIPEK